MNCIWEQDEDGNWVTSCGFVFLFNEGNPEENRMQFCCYCGKALVAVPHTEPAEGQE